jgi:hypothetical protein
MGNPADPQVEEHARWMVAVVLKLYELHPTEHAFAWHWLMSAQQGLHGRLPIDMILAGKGKEVLDLVSTTEAVQRPFDWRGPFPKKRT